MFSKSVTRPELKSPRRMKKSKDRRVFSKTTGKNPLNTMSSRPMRGGIRL